MRCLWGVDARGVPDAVARQLKLKKKPPPPWLIAAQRVPPAPSLTARPREWDISGKTSWEREAEKKRKETAANEQAATQLQTPDHTAKGWTHCQDAAFAVRPHKHNTRKHLKKIYAQSCFGKGLIPKIEYPEDRLRAKFYDRHPFELLRPRTMVETNGKNERDWSRLDGGKLGTISGENVINHQLYQMTVEDKTETEAYNDIVSEFYRVRAREEVAQRVAEEQATHHGALFQYHNSPEVQHGKEEAHLQSSYEFMEQKAQLIKIRKSATAGQLPSTGDSEKENL